MCVYISLYIYIYICICICIYIYIYIYITSSDVRGPLRREAGVGLLSAGGGITITSTIASITIAPRPPARPGPLRAAHANNNTTCKSNHILGNITSNMYSAAVEHETIKQIVAIVDLLIASLLLLLYDIILYHIISYYIISYDIILFYIILYHIIHYHYYHYYHYYYSLYCY